MTTPAVATHAEVAAFIREDPAFRRCLAGVGAEVGVGEFRPYLSALLGEDQRRLMLTGHGLDAVRALLAEEQDLVVRFTVASLRELAGPDVPEQEWPPGEEPDEDDRDVTLEVGGYGPEVLFQALCDLLVLRDGDPAALGTYLKSLRRPGVRAWRAALTRAYRTATEA
jgi:hypothetical protein